MTSGGGPLYFDPSSLGDPVAKLTEWGPCHFGGASFCTHVLRDDGRGRLSFRPTLGAISFYVFFVFFGCAALAMGVVSALSGPGLVWPFIELNLVLKDGRRLNVVDHGDQVRLRTEGLTLARYLGVPLWDPAP